LEEYTMTIETENEKRPRGKNGDAEESKDPVQVIREGAIAASIWQRQGPSGYAYYDFTLSRSWKSASSGRTGYSKNFFSRNAEELLSVTRKATEWIAEREPQLAEPQSEAA
jgi:hypothetical protein